MVRNNNFNQRSIMRRDILFALERLLQHETYVEIGVNEICSEAHISKPTFYRYFQSKDNIVRWMSKEAINYGVAEIGRKYSWFEGYHRTMTVFRRHKIFYSDPQSPALTGSLLAFSSDLLKNVLIETLTEYKKVELTEKLIFQIEALNFAQGHISRQWGAEGMKISPQTIADYLTSVVPHDLFKLLNEPTEVDALSGAHVSNSQD